MKGTLKLILGMLIPLAEIQGETLKNQDENTTGTDDIIGEGLVYIGHFAQYLLDKSNGKNAVAPKAPTI